MIERVVLAKMGDYDLNGEMIALDAILVSPGDVPVNMEFSDFIVGVCHNIRIEVDEIVGDLEMTVEIPEVDWEKRVFRFGGMTEKSESDEFIFSKVAVTQVASIPKSLDPYKEIL